MPFGDRFYFSRNSGIGGGRWVHPKDTMAASGVGYRNNMGGNGRAIFVPFGMNGVRINHSHLVGPPFPAFKAQF